MGDYNQWKTDFGSAVPAGTGADGNGDGIVDAADYTIWRDNLGATSGAGAVAAVPEPSGFVLSALGFAVVGIRKRIIH